MIIPFNTPWQEFRSTADNVRCATSKLLYLLDDLDDYTGNKVVAHCLVDDRGSSNFHTRGMACDLHIEGYHPLEQFIIAGRFPFTGIGIYADDVWYNPGLHVDIRQTKIGARWARMSDKNGLRYVPIDMEYIRRIS